MWGCPCAMMLVITLSWRQEARLETHILYNMGKSLSVWVRLGRAKRSHAKEALHGALSSTAHGGISKSLRVWVILGRANISQAKRGTYHASGLWVLTCLYGIMSL